MADEDIEEMMKRAKGEVEPQTPEEKVLGSPAEDEEEEPANQPYKKPKGSNRFLLLPLFAVVVTLGVVGMFLWYSFPRAPQPITAPQSGTGCVAYSGFACSNIVMSNDGNVSFVFSQTSGSFYYNVAMACAANITAMGAPNVSRMMAYLLQSGNASSYFPNPQSQPAYLLFLPSGETITAGNIKCYNQYALPLDYLAHNFSGAIWINYTYDNAPISPSNPMYTRKAAVFRQG